MKTETVISIETLIRIEGEKLREKNGYKIVKKENNFVVIATSDTKELSRLLLPKKRKKVANCNYKEIWELNKGGWTT